jgi:uncharacterized protein (TIGR03067 family)
MKLRSILLVVAAGLLIGADAKEDLKKEQDRLKGTWSVLAIEVPKGEKGPSDKELKEMKVIFADTDKVIMKFGEDEDKPAVYKLDPSQKPKEIDIMPGPRTLKGIYTLDGDTLKICLTEKGDRPKEFKVDADRKAALMTLKRDKQ